MNFYEIVRWTGAVIGLIGFCFIISVGAKYQIKFGILRSSLIEFTASDKKIMRSGAIIIAIGIFFFVMSLVME